MEAWTVWMLFGTALVAFLGAVGVAWRRWVAPTIRRARDAIDLVVDGVRHIREVQDQQLVNGSDITLRDEVTQINRKLDRDHRWIGAHDALHENLGLIGDAEPGGD